MIEEEKEANKDDNIGDGSIINDRVSEWSMPEMLKPRAVSQIKPGSDQRKAYKKDLGVSQDEIMIDMNSSNVIAESHAGGVIRRDSVLGLS